MKKINRKFKTALIVIAIIVFMLIPYVLYSPIVFLFPFELPHSLGTKSAEDIYNLQANILDPSYYTASLELKERDFDTSIYPNAQMYFIYNGEPYIFYSEKEDGKITRMCKVVDLNGNEYNLIRNAIKERTGFVFIVDDYLFYITGKGYNRTARFPFINTMSIKKVYYDISFNKQALLDNTSTEITITEEEYLEALNAFIAR